MGRIATSLAESDARLFARHSASPKLVIGPVADYPRFECSMNDVRRAGELIAGEMPWTDESAPKIRDAFQIANNWRDSHAYPMRSMRGQLAWYIRKLEIEGVTAARLKRMQAIRRKLRRQDLPQNLSQLQDLGGCRAILASIADVHTLVDELRAHSRHELRDRDEDDYIRNPKTDGYRSHHLKFRFRGRGGTRVHDGRRIEIQIRTRLQHSWATAVEAVGLFRGENLKGNQGSSEWLRLFKLVSAEFALAEQCREPPDSLSRWARVNEIKELNKGLKAAELLDNLSYAVRGTDELVIAPGQQPIYYLIRFDTVRKEVNVEPYWAAKSAILSYGNAEAFDNKSGKNTSNIVLVEADQLENLKDAYPNYFGDVQLFRMQLRKIVKGEIATEYIVRPQESIVPRPRENPDLGWLRRRIRWR